MKWSRACVVYVDIMAMHGSRLKMNNKPIYLIISNFTHDDDNKDNNIIEQNFGISTYVKSSNPVVLNCTYP